MQSFAICPCDDNLYLDAEHKLRLVVVSMVIAMGKLCVVDDQLHDLDFVPKSERFYYR
jgi:hypothetical protein